MPSARFEALLGSLRFRLAAWNTIALLLGIVATLALVREGFRLTLLHELDEFLLEDATEIRLAAEGSYPREDRLVAELRGRALGHVKAGRFVQIFRSDGTVLWESENTPEAGLPPMPARTPPRQTVANYRFVSLEVTRPGSEVLRVRVGSSLAFLDQDLDRLNQLLLVVGASVILLTPIGGYWLAGRATQPLNRMIETTAILHPDNLHERLPTRNTGDELDRLSQTINGLLDRLARYIHDRRDFLANAAHELRSPLAAMQSLIDTTLAKPRTAAEYEEFLGEVAEECREIGVLVNQLLLLAESDAGTLQLRQDPVRLDQVAAKSLEMFRGVAEAQKIELRLVRLDPVRITGDASRLRQVANNLIDNAIKYTPAGGQVRIDLEYDARVHAAFFRVHDTGRGIPAADLPHVFERFYRGDKSRTREHEARGSGLGLSICQSIVIAHGGHIWAESEPGQGTAVVASFFHAQLAAEPKLEPVA